MKIQKSFTVLDSQLVEALHKAIEDLDSDCLADLAQHVLGGEIYPHESEVEKYEIVPNETYFGALDKYKQ